MAQRITVEGTITPSTFLGTGARRTVTRTEFVDKLISKGFIRVVADDAVESQPAPKAAAVVEEIDVPGRNESRDTWAKFLTFQEVPFTDEHSRDELIELWYADHGQTVG
ncbi:hypothetical protein EV641_109176 [Rhodococcus sp. SMB37]|uniref:hypothetical protein n=1 Tax=Rhodococcus sp. SMB37 TaxID=2512213 RepID=UPI00104D21E6|nr:hypothetical protein [Rhodococcus sp. SMB37]TCN51785.1 hypothetical protein EV641_109176 [Rhodococcus sp. SMB37]